MSYTVAKSTNEGGYVYQKKQWKLIFLKKRELYYRKGFDVAWWERVVNNVLSWGKRTVFRFKFTLKIRNKRLMNVSFKKQLVFVKWRRETCC
jgi:hypothetical protein